MISAPAAPCVRCGIRERSGSTFLCTACLQDPDSRLETNVALHQNAEDARRYVIEHYHWAGGWDVGTRHDRP